MTERVFDVSGKRVWVAGHKGLVGCAVVRRLESEPIGELITAGSHEVDLIRQVETEQFVADTKPDLCILAAARAGGINANRRAQAQFLYDNLMIAANAIEACRLGGVARMVMLGSTCVYPREATQPMPEDALLTGPLEETNEGYAVAKIAGLELAKMYRRQYGYDAIAVMPTNLYGPFDNFDLETSHVMPALVRKIHEAKVAGEPTVTLWGTGTPRREFLHVDDLADAIIHATTHYADEQHLNIGVGEDLTINELAALIAEVIGWDGEFVHDTSMPDGTPRKLVDVTRLRDLGWEPTISLRDGIEQTYRWYLDQQPDG